jgi:hypothetical protein
MNPQKYIVAGSLLLLCGACSLQQRPSMSETSYNFDEAMRRTALSIKEDRYDGFILSAASQSQNEHLISAEIALAESVFVAAENGNWQIMGTRLNKISNPKIKNALIAALSEADLPVGGAK